MDERTLLDLALYQRIGIGEKDRVYLMQRLHGSPDGSHPTTRFDAYCVQCGKESTFASDNQHELLTITYPGPGGAHSFFSFGYKCTRSGHPILMVLLIKGTYLQKIGQWPSIADIGHAELEKYRTILGDQRRSELKRGIGLATHGIGIGSYVYLRRVFEALVMDAHDRAMVRPGWDEDAYTRARMDDRIAILDGELPPFMVENKAVYGILSKGVHELDEEECLAYVGTLTKSIRLMLDEALRLREEHDNREALAQEISKIKSKLKHDDNPGS